MRVFLSFVLGVTSAIACGGDDSGQPDASGDDAAVESGDEVDAGFTAPHPAMPQAINSGGSVIASPKLVAISFMGDPLQADVDAFASQMVSVTGYWQGAVAEYGVGAITSSVFHVPTAAPSGTIADTDVQSWITSEIQNDATFPPVDASTIYAVFYPSGTTVSTGFETTCDQIQGYHGSVPLSSTSNAIYAVVPRCPPPPVAGVTDSDQMTAEASHEVIEAATDPLPNVAPAYATVDDASHAWEVFGGEIGDLCAAFPDSFYRPPGFDHLVQRVWSNANAAASHDPCQPNGTTPYFNAAAVVSDTITVAVNGKSVKTQGVRLAVGATTTIPIDCYSDAPTSGPWKLSTFDVEADFYGEAATLQLSLDKTTCQNGDVVNMTIKLLRANFGGAPFWIESDLGSASTVWLGSVNPD